MRVISGDPSETRDAISQDWIKWLSRQGHTGIPVPNRLPDPEAYLANIAAECVILTGGNDLIQRPSAPDDTAPDRDRTERALVKSAMKKNKPIFGTCRGLHVLNDYFGGSLNAELKSITGGKVNHVGQNHSVELTPPFAKLSGRAIIDTNSYHDQGIRTCDLANSLQAFATSPTDNVIEGACHAKHPILAVQWHPERPNPENSFDDTLFNLLLRRGAFWRKGE